MKKKFVQPTEAELEILRVLWKHGSCTVKEVHKKLEDKPPRSYTTVLKFLQIMHKKGLVTRDTENRAHVYQADLSLEKAQSKMLSNIIDKVFYGSASKLVMSALSSKKASQKELKEIRRLLKESDK